MEAVSEKVLRKTFRAKTRNVTGVWRNVHKEEIHISLSLSNMVGQ